MMQVCPAGLKQTVAFQLIAALLKRADGEFTKIAAFPRAYRFCITLPLLLSTLVNQ